MAALYPTSAKTFTTKAAGQSILSAHVNDIQDEVTAIEGQLITSKLNTWNNDGWIPVTVTWAYASATTITVPSGAAAIYSVGDKIKLTQTTVKYFYIVGVADTVLTITGGTSFTLADEAITSPYYSHAASPVGFPQWFNWTPSITGMVVVGTPTYSGIFMVSGRSVTAGIRTVATISLEAQGANTYCSAPVTAPSGTNSFPIMWTNDYAANIGISMTNGQTLFFPVWSASDREFIGLVTYAI